MHNYLHIHLLSKLRFKHTYTLALLISCLIVGIAATLARATVNLAGALTRKPDIAVLLLLPDEEITHSTLLRSTPNGRDYLVDTKDGPKLVKLKKGNNQWYVQEKIQLHDEN